MIKNIAIVICLCSGLVLAQAVPATIIYDPDEVVGVAAAPPPPASPVPPVPVANGLVVGNFQPQLYVGGGGTYNGPGGGFAAESEFGVRIGNAPLYSYTTLEFAPRLGTIRTGTAYVVFQRENLAVLSLGDAGISTGSSTVGSFSAGGMALYDVGNRFNRGHFYVGVGMRLITTVGQGTQPIAVLTFGHGL